MTKVTAAMMIMRGRLVLGRRGEEKAGILMIIRLGKKRKAEWYG